MSEMFILSRRTQVSRIWVPGFTRSQGWISALERPQVGEKSVYVFFHVLIISSYLEEEAETALQIISYSEAEMPGHHDIWELFYD